MKEKKLNFILGRGRSGTTLLSKVLESNNDIISTPENLFIINLYSKYKNVMFQTDIIKNRFVEDIWREKNIINWKIDKNRLKKYLHKLKQPLTFSEVCEEVYRYYSSVHKNEAKYIFDKNPGYTIFIKELLTLYPQAKFLHIIRNPKDNVMSYQNVPFEPNNIVILAYRWNYYNKAIEKVKKDFPKQFLTIKYENLVSNQKKTIEKICAFYDVQFDEDMLNFYKKDSGIQQDWHKNLSKPLSNKNTNKWKAYFTKKQFLKIEVICKKLMKEYNYECTNDYQKLNIIDKLYYIVGFCLTKLELFLFKLPLNIRVFIINLYRRFNR